MADIIYIVREGQSENQFVKKILSPWILEHTEYRCKLMPYTVITSTDKRAGRVYRGGINSYKKVKRDLLNCMSYGHPVSSMIDFYRLPMDDFPGQEEARGILDTTALISYVAEEKRFVLSFASWRTEEG